MQFDIQMFADDEIQEYGDILDGAIDESSQEELPPIPKELEGIPEDIARDIMAKAATQNSEPPAPEQSSTETESSGETSVPYKRFKEAIDQKNELAQQLASYRERYGDISSQSPQPPQSQNFMPQFNADAIKQIDDAITQRAMQISGLSKEDVEGIDYLDDDDPKINLWNHARKLSEATVYNDIVANHIAQQQELQRMQMLQNQSVASYNDFVAKRQAAENFDAIRQYATGEFFNAQSPIDKEIITQSFAKLSQNMATPAEMMIVRDFFTRAENSFLNRGATPQTTPQKSMSQPKVNFPRTNQLNGTTGNGGGVTQAQLADMLQNKKWSEIPPSYQKILLGL